MSKSITHFLIFIHLPLLLSSSAAEEKSRAVESREISSREMDVTFPITTVPNPTNTPTLTPIITPAISTPKLPPSTTTVAGGGKSWCVASRWASETSLQVALDYACGYGGADCSKIQPGGGCYNPSTIRDHASFAFNNYYQKNPVPTSCNFGGTAVTTSTDPSSSTCHFPSTSTSSSVLNTTNANGATVFGPGPINPSSSSTPPNTILPFSLFTMSPPVLSFFLLTTHHQIDILLHYLNVYIQFSSSFFTM